MSIEAILLDLIKAIDRNTAAHLSTPVAITTTVADKPAPVVAAEKPVATKKTAVKPAPVVEVLEVEEDKPAITLLDIQKAVTLAATPEARATVVAILNSVGAKNASTVPPAEYENVLAQLNEIIALRKAA